MVEEEKKGPRMWSELFSGGNSLVDGRSNTQAVMDAMTPGAGLLGLGGGQSETPSLATSILSAPVSPYEQAKQNHGDGFGFFMKSMLVAKNPALAGWLMPELSASNMAQYKADLKSYNSILADQQQRQADRANLGEAVSALKDDDPTNDAWARSFLLESADNKLDNVDYIVNGKFKTPKRNLEVKELDGQMYYVDKDDPDAKPIPMTREDGSSIYATLSDGQAKELGFTRRSRPLLESLHKLEDKGVTIPREALTLMQQAQDQNGIFKPLAYQKLLNELGLSEDQRQYIRNAEALAMINLRKESGAAIGVAEMFNELKQDVVLSDMSDSDYDSQRGFRQNKFRQLGGNLPRHIVEQLKEEGHYETFDRLRENTARYVVKEDENGDPQLYMMRDAGNGYQMPSLEDLMTRGEK